MSRIVIAAKVPEGYSWLSREGNYRNTIFSQVAKKVNKGLTENLGWGNNSTIDDFVILKTTPKRAEEFTKESDKTALMMDRFTYKMHVDSGLFPEDTVILVETYGKNEGYSDFVKWRARNIVGKIIDDTPHPIGFELEVRLYQSYDVKVVTPAYRGEMFYLAGSPEFQKIYLKKVSSKFFGQRVTKL